MGVLKKAGGIIHDAAPWKAYPGYIKAGINIPERQAAKELNARSKEKLKQHKKTLEINRDPWAEGAPDMSDFDQVLAHWGITWEQLPAVRRRLAILAIMFSGLGIYCFLWMIGSLLFFGGSWWFSALPGLIAGAFCGVCHGWKVQVLYRKRFTYFKDWFLWGLFDCFGEETPIAQAERLREEAGEE